MITLLSEMLAGIVGYEVSGMGRADNYRNVVSPALELAAATGEVRSVTHRHR
jgi:hypothetical protein